MGIYEIQMKSCKPEMYLFVFRTGLQAGPKGPKIGGRGSFGFHDMPMTTCCHALFYTFLQQKLSDFDFVFLQNENRHNYNLSGFF